jgi:hypothetical protein
VLNDLAVLVEPENVNPGLVTVTRPDLVAVQACGSADAMASATHMTIIGTTA